MAEKTFEDNVWIFAGRDSKGKPKFRRNTNETLDYVKDFLDKKEVAYLV